MNTEYFVLGFKIQSALHIHGFSAHGFNQPRIKNIWGKKNCRKFQKAKLDSVTRQQLFIEHLHCIRY